MEKTLTFILTLIAVAAMLDFFGFAAWAMSGQTPPRDSYYLGQMTASVIFGN